MPILESDEAIRSLLTTARTIAVVGLSDHPYRDSYHIAEYLLDQGYRIIPVNPRVTSVFGLQAVPGLADIAEPVDIVDVFRRPEFLPAIVEEAIQTGARAVWMQLGTGHAAAAERASAAGLEVVVERCILVEHRRLLV